MKCKKQRNSGPPNEWLPLLSLLGLMAGLWHLLAGLGKKAEAIEHLKIVPEIVPNEPNARELLHALEPETNQSEQ